MLFFSYKSFLEEQDEKIDTGTYRIEVAELKSKVRFDLQGCLEATMASKAPKMVVSGNIQMDTRVIENAEFKSEFKFALRPFGGCHGLRSCQNSC